VTDHRLRSLGRDAAQGDLQAQARLLLERVRVGDLLEEWLRLAAFLGDDAARVAAGNSTKRYEEALEPIRGLTPWGQHVCVRAAVAAIRGALKLLDLDDPLVGQEIDCALRGEESRRDPWTTDTHPDNFVELLRSCAHSVSRASVPTALDWEEQLDYWVHEMLGSTFNELYGSSRWHRGLWERLSASFPVADELRGTGVWHAAVRSHVPRELIPWALALRGSST
jgi:hypothetical protein